MTGIISMGLLAVMLLAAVIPNLLFKKEARPLSGNAHRIFCIVVFALGCAARWIALTSLPGGMSAEEALVGVQAKALFSTGKDALGGVWPALFPQWRGEATGPLLSVITAPFVGLFGMNALTVRLPLALCSCAALPAAYGVGKALSGKAAGRWMLTLYALCPYFVLSARLTAGANLAVCLWPVAMLSLLCGVRRMAMLYLGAALTALLAYTQEMYAYIVPAGLLLALAFAVRGGVKRRHALGAYALAVLVMLPALCTAAVNLTGGEGFTLLGLIRIPRVENDAPRWVYDGMPAGADAYIFTVKGVFKVLVSVFFGVMTHENMLQSLYAPEGLYALYLATLPAALLGAAALLRRFVMRGSVKGERGAARAMVMAFAAATLAVLFLMGRREMLCDAAGLGFTVLLTAAGFCHIERTSRAGMTAAAAALACSFALLCVHLFGGAYAENANIYFHGLREAAQEAKARTQETGEPVVMTTQVYPQREPEAAAQMLLAYALDLESKDWQDGTAAQTYSCAYVSEQTGLDEHTIYILRLDQTDELNADAFDFYEYGDFALLIPME